MYITDGNARFLIKEEEVKDNWEYILKTFYTEYASEVNYDKLRLTTKEWSLKYLE